MAKIVTITYTAPVAPAVQPINEICRIFKPDNAAADNAAFEGTYYDTNVDGWAPATTLEDFMKSCVAHPGLIAALRKAIKDGEYSFKSDDEKELLCLEEVSGAISDQGFVIAIADEPEPGPELGE